MLSVCETWQEAAPAIAKKNHIKWQLHKNVHVIFFSSVTGAFERSARMDCLIIPTTDAFARNVNSLGFLCFPFFFRN